MEKIKLRVYAECLRRGYPELYDEVRRGIISGKDKV